MRVAVIADTHGRLPDSVHHLFSGCQLILHAGDIGSPAILAELELIAPVLAVLGNNDRPSDYPELPYARLAPLAQAQAYMAHTPADIEHYLRNCTGTDNNPGLPDLAICAHTHQPADELLYGVRVINPGSATRPRGGSPPSAALLELSGAYVEKIRFVRL